MPRSTEAPVVPIIGGGPAGMSCALWLHNYGLHPVIIEKENALGGMARLSPYPNEWLLGQRGKSARENAAEFAAHIRELGIDTWRGATLQRLTHEKEQWRLDLSGDRRSLSGAAVVIATGTRFAGEEWLDEVANARRVAAAGRLHLGASAIGEPNTDLGSHVAVIGGGDNAFDVSRILAEKGVRVTVIMRSKSPKAQPLLVGRLRRHQTTGLVKVMPECTVEALEEVACGVRLRLNDGREIDADHVVLLFGYRPNTNEAWLCALAPATDALGYLVVDGNMETSCRGVFAAGDVANPAHPSIATALASGAIAARQIAKRLAGETIRAP
ncbi:MAG TPA: NAD(P)/FAD-dependent oxidoreductase [Xanthobacteraceae bacterium]|jgi:thioredoxin reductase|nr:NAD(P)/FAD-dependent oxidoreductase [Xanthobacteraceae bacterium]